MFTSKKIADHLKVSLYQAAKCGIWIHMWFMSNYIGYTCRHLHQRVEEHKHSVIGKHLRHVHGLTPDNLIENFEVLKKCRGKLECLIYEMLWIKSKRPKLNSKTHSIRSKLFTWVNAFMLIYFLTPNIYKYAFSVISSLFIWQRWHKVLERSCCFAIVNFLAEMFI